MTEVICKDCKYRKYHWDAREDECMHDNAVHTCMINCVSGKVTINRYACRQQNHQLNCQDYERKDSWRKRVIRYLASLSGSMFPVSIAED